MPMSRKTPPLLSTLGLALAAFAATGPAASAQDAGSLIIAVSTCPQGYDGANYAADCGDTPAAGVDFALGTPGTGNVETSTSRADGLVTFSLAPYDLDPTGPDTVTVGEPAAQALDYAVFCTVGGEPLDFAYETIDFQPGGPLFGIRFAFEPGDQIACEWYNIPQPMHPGDDGADRDPVQQLPNTGIGSGAAGDDDWRALPQLALLAALIGGSAVGRRLAA
jgi:hypothetical protein